MEDIINTNRQDESDDDTGEYKEWRYQFYTARDDWWSADGSAEYPYPNTPPPLRAGELCRLEQFREGIVRAIIISKAHKRIVEKVLFRGTLKQINVAELNSEGPPTYQAAPSSSLTRKKAKRGKGKEKETAPRVGTTIEEETASLNIGNGTENNGTSTSKARSTETPLPPRDGSKRKRTKEEQPTRRTNAALAAAEGGGEAQASPEARTEGESGSPPRKRAEEDNLSLDQRRRLAKESCIFRDGVTTAIIAAAYGWLDGIDQVRCENPTLRAPNRELQVNSILIREALANLTERLAAEESRSSGLALEEESLKSQVAAFEEKTRQLNLELKKANSALKSLQATKGGEKGHDSPPRTGELDTDWPSIREDTTGWGDTSPRPQAEFWWDTEITPEPEVTNEEVGGLAVTVRSLVTRMEALEAKVATGTSGKETRHRSRKPRRRTTTLETSAERRGRENGDGRTYASIAARPPPRTIPRDDGAAKKKRTASTAPPPTTSGALGTPRRVTGGGERGGNGGKRRKNDGATRGASGTSAKIRLPSSAAVLITAEDRGIYKDLLVEARSSISLEELGAEGIRSRRSQAGDILLEIPGEGSNVAANHLVERLRSLFAGRSGVQVTRPRLRLDLWVSNCGVHTAPTAVAAGVAAAGGCAVDEVRVTPAGATRRGRKMAFWASCPAMAAKKIAENGEISLGWEKAKAEISKGRPLRCYRCLAGGHKQQRCPSRIDRARCCFNCGEEGHGKDECERAPRCPVCAVRGLVADHRAGALACPPVPPGPLRGERDGTLGRTNMQQKGGAPQGVRPGGFPTFVRKVLP